MPNPRSILYVEDDPDTREAMKKVLRLSDIEVSAYASAEDTIAHLGSHSNFQSAILDLHLPGMQGDELALILRQYQPESKIVFVTAAYETDYLIQLIPNCTVIRKPLGIRQLQQLLECLHSATLP